MKDESVALKAMNAWLYKAMKAWLLKLNSILLILHRSHFGSWLML